LGAVVRPLLPRPTLALWVIIRTVVRASAEVIDELLKAMKDLVRDYPRGVNKIENRSRLVDVTAFFPGGTGLWRGAGPFVKLPPEFPTRPVMFVSRAFSAKVHRDGEAGKCHRTYW